MPRARVAQGLRRAGQPLIRCIPAQQAPEQAHIRACVSCVVGSEPLRLNSTSTSSQSPPTRSRANRPMRSAAAQWELDGPRMTGPITSLKMLTIMEAALAGEVGLNLRSSICLAE